MGWFIISRALVVRLMFALHGFLTIWWLTMVSHDSNHWYATASLTGLLLETIFTIYVKKGQEWKWFCPSVLFFLLSVVPPIWFLELHELEMRIREEMMRQNASQHLSNLTTEEEVAGILANMKIPLQIQFDVTSEKVVRMLEQLLLLFLILGRWILPKGELTHDQLSELLLVYIATAADIVEFFDAFKEDAVKFNRPLCVVILSIWSWSLLQFTMVLTATKKVKEAAPKSMLGIQQGLYSTFKSAPKKHRRSPMTTPLTPQTPRALYKNADQRPVPSENQRIGGVSTTITTTTTTTITAGVEGASKADHKSEEAKGRAQNSSKKVIETPNNGKESIALINFSDDDDDDDDGGEEEDEEDEEEGGGGGGEVDDNRDRNVRRDQKKTSAGLSNNIGTRSDAETNRKSSIAADARRTQDCLKNPLLARPPTGHQPRKTALLLPRITARGPFPRLTPMEPVDRKEAKVQMEPCCTPEVYGILISMFLQDAPFLVLRLLLIFQYDVVSYTNMFFTCKNTLVCVLLIYRLTVIQIERCQPVFEDKRRRKKSAKEKRDSGALTGLVVALGPGGKSGGTKKVKDAADVYYRYSTKVNLREYKGASTLRKKANSNSINLDYTIHEGYQAPQTADPHIVTSSNDYDDSDSYYNNYYRNCCMMSASDTDLSLISAPDRMNIEALYELY